MRNSGPIVLIGDVHLTRRAPSSCTDSYLEDLITLLNQVARLCRQREAAALVIAGDLFHHKAPSRTDHGLVRTLIELFRSVSCPVYVVIGNHDIQNDRVESVAVTQPLGVLFESGAARRLDGWMRDTDGEPSGPVYGVAWQQDWSEERIREVLDTYRKTTMVACKTRCPLVVAHAPIYPPGQELKWENTPAAWWAGAMDGFGCVFYGHVHPWHGVYQAGGVTFCNHGALSRGSLHESELTRQVGCTLWDSETGAFEFVPLDAKPASEVFRLQEKQQAADMHGRLDEFLASVGSTTLEAVSVESVIGHIRTLGLGKDAEDLAAELLTEAAHGGK